VKESPLGPILAHWKDIGGPPGRTANERPLKYWNRWWPLCRLDEEKWPLNGTLNYNTLLQRMLFLRRERKQDEVSYADVFLTLQNHPEYQIDRGLTVPRDSLALAVEKDNKRERKGKLERSCSACRIGQRCTKSYKMRHPGGNDLPEHYEPPVGVQQMERDSSNLETPLSSPISSHTRTKRGAGDNTSTPKRSGRTRGRPRF